MGDLVLKKYIGIFIILIFAASSFSAEKINKPEIRQIDTDILKVYTGDQSKEIFGIEKATASDACSTLIAPAAWVYEQWVYGDEWYFAYIDPEITCLNPYPYSVRIINFYMNYDPNFDYNSTPMTDTFSIQLSYVYRSGSSLP